MDTILDIRSLDGDQGCLVAVEQFADLDQGESFVLQSDRSVEGVLDLFEERHGGAYDWRPLLEGPALWQVLVARRSPGTRQLVLEFMNADHRHINELFDKMTTLSRAQATDELSTTARHLDTALRKHFAVEEELLLPVISAKLSMPRGPAAVLRDEHVQALDLMRSLLSACEAASWGVAEQEGGPSIRAVLTLVTSLDHLLRSHQGMEERILYAVTDLLLSPDERKEMLRRCQRV